MSLLRICRNRILTFRDLAARFVNYDDGLDYRSDAFRPDAAGTLARGCRVAHRPWITDFAACMAENARNPSCTS